MAKQQELQLTEPLTSSPSTPSPTWEQVREALASLTHEQWSGWMQHLFRKCAKQDGGWWMPAEWADRWQRQMTTPYEELSGPEQDSDRKEADRVLALIDAARAAEASQIKELKDELDRQNSTTHALNLAAQVRKLEGQVAALSAQVEQLTQEKDKLDEIAMDALACWQGEDDMQDSSEKRSRSARSRATLRTRLAQLRQQGAEKE